MKFPPWLKVYGDQSYRGDCPMETAEQITFFGKLRREFPEVAIIATHIKNEGKRNHHQAAKDKAEGLSPGAADISIPGCPAFICELKRRDHTKSRFQKDQPEYLEAAHNMGAFVCVALGYDAAFEALKEWLAIVKKVS